MLLPISINTHHDLQWMNKHAIDCQTLNWSRDCPHDIDPKSLRDILVKTMMLLPEYLLLLEKTYSDEVDAASNKWN